MLPRYGRAVVVFDRSTNAAYVLNPTVQPSATSSNTPVVAATGAPAAAPATSIPSSSAPNAQVAPADRDAIHHITWRHNNRCRYHRATRARRRRSYFRRRRAPAARNTMGRTRRLKRPQRR